MEDDLIWSRQNYQKNFINNRLKEDQFGLKKVSERLEDSCQSEILTTNNRLNHYIDVNNISMSNPNYVDYGIAVKGVAAQSQEKSYTQQVLSPCLFQESFNASNQQDLQLNTLKNGSFNSRPIEGSEQPQYTFNDENIKQSSKRFNISTNKLKDSQVVKQKTKSTPGFDGGSKFNFMKKDFKILTHARKKMMDFFLSKTFSGRTQMLQNSKIQQIINDSCDVGGDIKQNWFIFQYMLFFQLLKQSKLNFLKFIPIFNPSHPITFTLNIFFCIFNCCFYTFLSIVVVFRAVIPTIAYGPIFTLWILEILLKLNTSIYIKTDLIKKREVIFAIYLKHNAIYDIIPFFLLVVQPSFTETSIIMQIISFIKLKNILEELTIIQKQLCMAIQKYYYFIQLINLILKLFLVAHFFACLWYLIGQIELKLLDYESTWYDDSIGADGSWWKLYLCSFYWSLTLMATGSNEAASPLQMFFTSFIMLFTTIIFGYFLNIIGIILSENDEEEINQRKDINIINKYMRKRNISKNLQRVVNLDIEYFYEKNYKKTQEENESVFEKLSMHLHDELLTEYNGRIINKIGCLKQNFSQETLDKLSLQLEEAYFLPNQVLFSEESTDDYCMMYVVEGEVELTKKISENSNVRKKVQSIEQDQVFGQFSFFTGFMRGAQAQAKTFTTVIKIYRDIFFNIIQQNEKDLQQYFLIKDSILQYKDYRSIQIQCGACNKTSHFTSDCPLVHYDKEEYAGKLKYYEKLKQPRGSKNRRDFKSENTLLQQRNIEQTCNQFEQENLADNEEGENNITRVTTEADNQDTETICKKSQVGSERYLNRNRQQSQDIDSIEDKSPSHQNQILNSPKNQLLNSPEISFIKQQNALSNFSKGSRSYFDVEKEVGTQNSYNRDDHPRNFSKIMKSNFDIDRDTKIIKSNFDTDKDLASIKTVEHQRNGSFLDIINNLPILPQQQQIESQFKLNQRMDHTDSTNGDPMKSSKQKQNKKQEIVISKELMQLFSQENKLKTKVIDYDNDRAELANIFKLTNLNNPWLFERQKDYLIYFPEEYLEKIRELFRRRVQIKNENVRI